MDLYSSSASNQHFCALSSFRLFSQITCIFSPQPPLPCSVTLLLSLHGRFGLFIQTSGSLRQPFVASHRETERKGERERKEGVGGVKMEKDRENKLVPQL